MISTNILVWYWCLIYSCVLFGVFLYTFHWSEPLSRILNSKLVIFSCGNFKYFPNHHFRLQVQCIFQCGRFCSKKFSCLHEGHSLVNGPTMSIPHCMKGTGLSASSAILRLSVRCSFTICIYNISNVFVFSLISYQKYHWINARYANIHLPKWFLDYPSCSFIRIESDSLSLRHLSQGPK